MKNTAPMTLDFNQLCNDDVAIVGGKNASLGELTQNLSSLGIRVPRGFATSATAYRQWLQATGLDLRIGETLKRLASEPLAEVGARIRRQILRTSLTQDLRDAIADAYRHLARDCGEDEPAVAVRSSATAEDLPEASFAGQLDTYLNVRGEANLLDACRRCFASLYTDRAIAYRQTHGFDHASVAVSVGVQRMVDASHGSAGVMFTLDTESGFRDVVAISANWGFGETIVQGIVNPDDYVVFKPLLRSNGTLPIIAKSTGSKSKKMVDSPTSRTGSRLLPTTATERTSNVLDDATILSLAKWGLAIEDHYGHPMDIEWVRDGATGHLFIVQARPETVQTNKSSGALQSFTIGAHGSELAHGQSIGDGIASGVVCRLNDISQVDDFVDQAVLVTARTDPDWLPVMRRAAALVTDHGGRTSHAAIVSRELGLPAVIGTGNATRAIANEQEVTVSCAEGDVGFVYAGSAEYTTQTIDIADIPSTQTQVMLNIANPAAAMRWWQLPTDGIGLLRMEFIINNTIKVHPMALINPDAVRNKKTRRDIDRLTEAWSDPQSYFVDNLARDLARIAATQYPKPVIVRMSDFKSNEYAHLIGGRYFEPQEENPMLGWRGASRYYSEYREGFALECAAIKKVREEIGLTNVLVMIPFCRTPQEADLVLKEMAQNGLVGRKDDLHIYVMAEIPANVILAEAFAERFDGFSIGSNDLTQLVLGVDRDSERLSHLFDDRHPAVRHMISNLIEIAHKHERKVGLCGEAPSNHPEFADFLVACGIDSISVNPSSFVAVKQAVAAAEEG